MVARVNQAARLLSSFCFEGIYHCYVNIYFANKYGETFGTSPDEFNNPGYMKWNKKQWRDFILAAYDKYNKTTELTTSVDAVRAIVIWFKKEKDLFARSYYIEASDLCAKDCFDRLLISKDYLGDRHEAYLTRNESSGIHGAKDVIKLSDNIPEVRISANKYPDLAKITLGTYYARHMAPAGLGQTYYSMLIRSPRPVFPRKEPFGKP